MDEHPMSIFLTSLFYRLFDFLESEHIMKERLSCHAAVWAFERLERRHSCPGRWYGQCRHPHRVRTSTAPVFKRIRQHIVSCLAFILRPHRIVRKQYQTPFQIFKSHIGRVLIFQSSLFNIETNRKILKISTDSCFWIISEKHTTQSHSQPMLLPLPIVMDIITHGLKR